MHLQSKPVRERNRLLYVSTLEEESEDKPAGGNRTCSACAVFSCPDGSRITASFTFRSPVEYAEELARLEQESPYPWEDEKD